MNWNRLWVTAVALYCVNKLGFVNWEQRAKQIISFVEAMSG